MDTRAAYLVLLGAVAATRLVELRRSARNERALRAEGGRATGPRTFAAMVALHAALFVAPALEVYLLNRRLIPWLAGAALALLAGATALRILVIRTLGRFWTATAVVSPATQVCDHGPYRHIRHPNYVAVALEFVALPLVHTAFISAIVLSLGNAAVLAARVREEERALFAIPSYAEKMGRKARFIPGIF